MNSWRALVSSVDRSAVVDGESLLKYVFNAQDGSEELFDLRADPKETINLATKPAHSRSVARLRAALVKQYQREGRGEGARALRAASQRPSPAPRTAHCYTPHGLLRW